MARDNSYFIISGFISLFLFSFFLFLFFFMMFSSSKIDTFALTKDNYISISLDMVPTPTKELKKEVFIPVEESQSIVESKDVDVGDLFSDVWTKDIKITKQKIKQDNKRLELIRKKIKTKKENSVNQTSKTTSESEANIVSNKNKKSSSGDEVNEYLAKIQAIVYKHFHPPNNSQGHTVKAVIKLNAIGKVLDFRILTYSSNQALNQECDKIKSRLLGVLFPSNPQNQSFNTIVNITSDKN
ncbi:MAG: TonB C-terminal domain-containing protein [Sulfurimonas sp.]|nr:TonB C-terminal domain-containing protein [Sulfurimonas sp.]